MAGNYVDKITRNLRSLSPITAVINFGGKKLMKVNNVSLTTNCITTSPLIYLLFTLICGKFKSDY